LRINEGTAWGPAMKEKIISIPPSATFAAAVVYQAERQRA